MFINKYIAKISSNRAEIVLLIFTVLLAPLIIISNLVLIPIIIGPLLIGATVLIWKKPFLATTFLLILLPFHSLAMRIIQVEMGLSDNMILLISMWKEYVLLVLVIRVSITNRISTNIGLVDGLIILYIIISFIYIFLAEGLGIGLYGFRGMIEPFAFYLIGKKLTFPSTRLAKILKYLLVVAVILSIFGAIQAYALGIPFLTKYRTEYDMVSTSHFARIGGRLVVRASSTFTSPNQLGMYLAILILIVLGINTKKRITFKEIIILSVLLLGLLISLSRSSWLALFVGIFTMLVIRLKISKRLIFTATVLAILALPVIIRLNIITRIVETLTLTEPSAAGKLPSILNGIDFVLQNPFGIGLGMTGPRSIRFTEIQETIHSENFYVLMAMEIGFIGLLIYISLIWAVLSRLYKNSRIASDPWKQGLAFGTLLAVLGVAAGVMFIPSLQEITVASLLWFFIGVNVSSERKSISDSTTKSKSNKMEQNYL